MSRTLRLSSPYVRYLAWAVDVLIITALGLAVYAEYHQTWQSWWLVPPVYVVLMAVAAALLGLFSGRLYRSWRVNDLGLMLRTMSSVWLMVVAVLTLGLFLSKSSVDVSRVWFLTWGLGCWFVLGVQRLLAYGFLRAIRRQGLNFRTVLIVGFSSTSEQVLDVIAKSAWSGLRVVGQVAAEDLESYLSAPEKAQPNEVWLCMPMSDAAGIQQALNALRFSTADIRLVPDLFALKLINHGVSQALGIPMLDLSTSPVTGATRLLKNIEDKVLAFVILLLISPLMLAIAVLIKLTSPGPVVFKQMRLCWNGREIRVYKFRTMVVHQEEGQAVTQATVGDQRITPVGAFLRRTSLDELPQFFNVLQGKMSIVGPRPHALAHNDYYKDLVPKYMLRHKVKPGITGWAQVNGFRGETDTLDKMEKRIEYDLFYIENMSIAFDLKIIAMTLFKGFVHRNAY